MDSYWGRWLKQAAHEIWKEAPFGGTPMRSLMWAAGIAVAVALPLFGGVPWPTVTLATAGLILGIAVLAFGWKLFSIPARWHADSAAALARAAERPAATPIDYMLAVGVQARSGSMGSRDPIPMEWSVVLANRGDIPLKFGDFLIQGVMNGEPVPSPPTNATGGVLRPHSSVEFKIDAPHRHWIRSGKIDISLSIPYGTVDGQHNIRLNKIASVTYNYLNALTESSESVVTEEEVRL